MTDKMRKGWEIKKLGEVCEKITDGTHQTPKYFDNGYIFLSSGNVTTGTINWDKIKYIDEEQHLEMQKRVSPKLNDILLAKNGTTGVAAMVDREVDFDIYVSLALLRPLEVITPHYLLYFINSPLAKAQFNSRLKGAGVPNLHLAEIREVEIPFPNDKKEQQRIVSILDEAFSSIEQAKENLQRNLQNAKELFQSEMNAIFENGKLKIEKGEWEEKTLGEVATFRNGISFTKQSRGASTKIVGVKDFQKHFWINFDNLESVTLDGELNDLDTLIENDILAVRSNGNPELIGRCILAGSVPEKTSHSGFTIRIRLSNTNNYFAQYLCHFLKSEKAKRQLIDGGTGISIKSLNQGTLSSLSIPFPSFIKQQKIVHQLDTLSAETKRLEAMYQQKLDALEELKKSILQKAFSGELKVEN